MHGVAVYSANKAKLPRSKASLHSRAARVRGRTFFRVVANNTPYYGCCTLSGLSSESKARSFSQKQNVVHASLRERGLLSASATWSIRPLGKSTASFNPAYRCLPRQGGRCMPERGRHGKAPCGHFAMPRLLDYPYTFISILLSVLLYIYIATLPY